MKPPSLYGHLAELITAVSGATVPADVVARRYFRERHYIGSKERRWLASGIFGVVRHARLLDALVTGALGPSRASDPALRPVALGAAHALAFSGDTADEVAAAITDRWVLDGSVPLPGEFLTAVDTHLRRIFSAAPTAESLALQHSFSDDAVREWTERLGLAETGALLAALNTEAPVTIRVNTLRCTVAECAARLAREGIATGPGALSPFALRLPARAQLESLPAYREGWFELQDEGSQLLSLLLQPEQGARVVDACAGAGGKTMHLAALLKNKGSLTAIDPEASKLRNLRERAERAGARLGEVILARHDDPALARLAGKAGGVLVDAPCSGLGTVRRNPWLKAPQDPSRVRARTALQADILRHAARMVRPGGRLVYATCTLLRAENEDVVDRFLAEHDTFAPASAAEILRAWGITLDDATPTMMLWPHRTGTDGFFAAVLHRAG